MTVPREVLELDPGLGDWCILHAWRGSVAHGMYVRPDQPSSTDDKDTMAVCVPPPELYFGCGDFPTPEEGHKGYFQAYGDQGTREIFRDPYDVVIYEARKAIYLMMLGNPNMLSLLWIPPRQRILVSPAGQLILDNREAFSGRHVYQSFVGYAKAQFTLMGRGAVHGRMGEKRKQLVAQYGYDPKSAAHLIRLLRMGAEFLRDGELHVDRGGFDAAELIAIKQGEWSLEYVKAEAERQFRRAEDAYDRSTLPVRPDEERIQRLCVDVIRMAHRDLRPNPYDE